MAEPSGVCCRFCLVVEMQLEWHQIVLQSSPRYFRPVGYLEGVRHDDPKLLRLV